MAEAPKAFILVGPTASGKSTVAQRIAEQTGCCILSADSMAVYRGMDIGTAKPSPDERARVKTFGIDLASPTEPFSVGDWLKAVGPAFDGAAPVVAGGTGLYVKCLLQGLDPLSPADEELRARAATMTLYDLQAEAEQTAPEAYRALADKENPRRLIRLLEHGEPLFAQRERELPAVVGLHVERDVLYRRIAERVEKMYAGGLLDEARGLIDLDLSLTAQKAIGYAEAFAVLRGERSEAEAKEKTIVRTRQLAKRQMTWFRHQLRVEWIYTAGFPDVDSLAAEVSNMWHVRGPVPLAGVCL